MPLVPSGVAIQTRYIIEGLLKTGNYTVRSIGGAMRHTDYRPCKLQEYGDDWIILPVDGYGSQDLIREILDSEKPDALWFMTDPRFYTWLFAMTDEIRARNCPVLYNHVWDEYPVPIYNKPFYQSCDFIGCISKLTYNVLKELNLESRAQYIPHSIDVNIFRPLSDQERAEHKTKVLGKANARKFVFFYNSRNARRKMTADILVAFAKLLDIVGKDKAFMFMHTDPSDQEGSNLFAVAHMLGLESSQLLFSTAPQPSNVIASYYNLSDALINISNNEGFGLSCLEALACGRLAIVSKTGGLIDQIYAKDGTELGVAIEPATRTIQGSQQIPYIFDCRVAHKDVTDAMLKLYNMPIAERKPLEQKAREHAVETFPMQSMIDAWDNVIKSHVNRAKHSERVGTYPVRVATL